jgi:hypothetical protein
VTLCVSTFALDDIARCILVAAEHMLAVYLSFVAMTTDRAFPPSPLVQ